MAELRAGKNNTQLLKLFGELECNKEAIVAAAGKELSERTIQTMYADVRYEPYIKREEKEIDKTKQYQKMTIPADFSYTDLPGLSKELQQKLTKYRPATIAQSMLITGMTPAAVSLIIFKVREYKDKI
jgi:tRNA uridine 5-carboxymethylaminomethyl modification enzyme